MKNSMFNAYLSFVKEWTLDPSTAESLPKLVFLYHQVIGDLEVTAWIHHYTFISLISGTKQQNAGWIYNLVFTEKLDGNSECSAFSCVSSPPNLTVLQRLISPPTPRPPCYQWETKYRCDGCFAQGFTVSKYKSCHFNLSLQKHFFLYTRKSHEVQGILEHLSLKTLSNIFWYLKLMWFKIRTIFPLLLGFLFIPIAVRINWQKWILFSLSIESIFTELTLNDYC